MTEKKRPSWEEYFLAHAVIASTRSTCLRRSVGAIVVLNKQVLTTGYNGQPRGLQHCTELGCLRAQRNIPRGEALEVCRVVHAEQNAIIQAAYHGYKIAGATLYCTDSPCTTCAKMLINADIRKIVYLRGYPDSLGTELLKQTSIELVKWPEENLDLNTIFKYAWQSEKDLTEK